MDKLLAPSLVRERSCAASLSGRDDVHRASRPTICAYLFVLVDGFACLAIKFTCPSPHFLLYILLLANC